MKCQYMLCHKIIIFLQAERCRREVRREKFTHKNCTLPMIHLGPAGRRVFVMVGICRKAMKMMAMKVMMIEDDRHYSFGITSR